MRDHRVRVAMIGQKGYPPVHGGIERHVAELSRRLVQRGLEVDIFSRPHYSPAHGPTDLPGLRVVRRPSLPTKHLDAITHSSLVTLEAVWHRYDLLHFHALGPGLLAGPARLCGRRTVLTVHGLDWQREKWGPLARLVLRAGEEASARWPHRTIVVSRALQEHYRHRHGVETVCIPNGISPAAPRDPVLLDEHGIVPPYVLFVGRLVPEKGCHILVEAHRRLPEELRRRFPLVIAGDDPFGGQYVRRLRAADDAHVRWLGFVHGPLLDELYDHAGLVVLPSTLEGLSIALLEAMSHRRACLVSDIPPNREAGGEAVAYVQPEDPVALAAAMSALLDDRQRRLRMGGLALARVRERYSWEQVVAATLAVYGELLGREIPV